MQILDRKLDTISISVPKPPLTTPKEFHFATDERLGPAAASVFDQFDKVLSVIFFAIRINNLIFISLSHLLFLFCFFLPSSFLYTLILHFRVRGLIILFLGLPYRTHSIFTLRYICKINYNVGCLI